MMKFLITSKPKEQPSIIKDLEKQKKSIQKLLKSRRVRVVSWLSERALKLPVLMTLDYKVISPAQIELTIVMTAEPLMNKKLVLNRIIGEYRRAFDNVKIEPLK